MPQDMEYPFVGNNNWEQYPCRQQTDIYQVEEFFHVLLWLFVYMKIQLLPVSGCCQSPAVTLHRNSRSPCIDFSMPYWLKRNGKTFHAVEYEAILTQQWDPYFWYCSSPCQMSASCLSQPAAVLDLISLTWRIPSVCIICCFFFFFFLVYVILLYERNN